jgi:hypothetical protein
MRRPIFLASTGYIALADDYEYPYPGRWEDRVKNYIRCISKELKGMLCKYTAYNYSLSFYNHSFAPQFSLYLDFDGVPVCVINTHLSYPKDLSNLLNRIEKRLNSMRFFPLEIGEGLDVSAF